MVLITCGKDSQVAFKPRALLVEITAIILVWRKIVRYCEASYSTVISFGFDFWLVEIHIYFSVLLSYVGERPWWPIQSFNREKKKKAKG